MLYSIIGPISTLTMYFFYFLFSCLLDLFLYFFMIYFLTQKLIKNNEIIKII
jgi:hypothetical protein